MKTERLVEVVWRDAHFHLDEPVGLLEMRTVGWLIEESTTFVLVAGERGESEDYFRAYTAIPRGCICEMRDLAS